MGGSSKKVLFVVISVLGLLPCGLWGQNTLLFKGDTVQVIRTYASWDDSTPLKPKGILLDFRNDSLFLRVGNSELAIPRHDIHRLKVVRGKKSKVIKGAAIGALLGGTGLGLVGALSVSTTRGGWMQFSPEAAFAIGFYSGALIGGLFGAIIGSAKGLNWVNVPVDSISVKERRNPPPKSVKAQLNEVLLRRWQISFTFLGAIVGGPYKDIEEAMIRDGFDETLPGGWLGGPVKHPFSRKGDGLSWSLQLDYSLKSSLDGAILISHNYVGFTSGYCDPVFLNLHYYSTIVSLMLILKPSNRLNLGVGPAWFINKIEQEEVSKIVCRDQKGQVGLVFAISSNYPSDTRFFIHLDGEYRLVPKATYGPFKDTYTGSSLTQLAPFQANFSHGVIGLGIGFRY